MVHMFEWSAHYSFAIYHKASKYTSKTGREREREEKTRDREKVKAKVR